MARLEDIPLNERKMMEELDCTGFEGRRPWVAGPALSKRRIAIVSTAALNLRSDAVYQRDAVDYRVIPGDTDPGDIVMSHVSVNFDRTGFQRFQRGLCTLGGKRRQHKYRRTTLAHDRARGFDAIHHRHVHVHGDHVRLQFAVHSDRLRAITRLADDFQQRMRSQYFPQAIAEET